MIALELALAHLRAGPLRSTVLVLGLALALFLPGVTFVATERLEAQLYERAEASGLVVGVRGDQLDLVLSALYFRGRPHDQVPYSLLDEVSDYGPALPVHVGHTANGYPVVGTDIDVLQHRGLTLAAGRRPAVLAEVLAGAHTAEAFQLAPGDTVRGDLANLYDVAGAYPLQLSVVGVLEPSGGPEDAAFLADLRTSWALDGALHGHDPLQADDDLSPEDGEVIEASAAVFLFQDVSQQVLDSFHLHGREDELPVDAIVVWPRDQQAHDQLLGDAALDERYQAVRPVEVVRTVLGIVLSIRELLSGVYGLVGLSTLAFAALVLHLTLRLRDAELTLLVRLGASRATVARIVLAEQLVLLVLAALLAAAATAGAVTLLETLW